MAAAITSLPVVVVDGTAETGGSGGSDECAPAQAGGQEVRDDQSGALHLRDDVAPSPMLTPEQHEAAEDQYDFHARPAAMDDSGGEGQQVHVMATMTR